MRLLLVDDEPRLVETLQRGLRGEGYVVDTAVDGELALELAQGGGYAAIVLDVMLPKLSGYQVCVALRRLHDWTPVMMLTAKDGDYDQADGLDCGADDYLTKPSPSSSSRRGCVPSSAGARPRARRRCGSATSPWTRPPARAGEAR